MRGSSALREVRNAPLKLTIFCCLREFEVIGVTLCELTRGIPYVFEGDEILKCCRNW